MGHSSLPLPLPLPLSTTSPPASTTGASHHDDLPLSASHEALDNANYDRPATDFNFNDPPVQNSCSLGYLDPILPPLPSNAKESHLYAAKGKDHVSRLRRIPGALTAHEQSRYSVYRSRSRKDIDKEDGKPVWSDELEDAFQIAIRRVPPWLGKKKVPLRQEDGTIKQCGRNELIARVIKQLTGVTRKRKQISSHIQVISGFLREESEKRLTSTVAQFVRTDASKVSAASSKNFRFDEAQGCLVASDALASRAVALRPGFLPTSINHSYGEPGAAMPSGAYAHSTTVQAIDFKMQIYSRGADQAEYELRHTCTEVQTPIGAPSRALDEIEDWRRLFPDLSDRLSDPNSPACDVVLLESNITVMDASPTDPSAVAIHFEAILGAAQHYRNWQLRSTFYEDMGHQKKQVPNQGLNAEPLDGSRARLVDIALDSKWWVTLFEKAMAQRQHVKAEGDRMLQEAGHWPCDCLECRPLRRAAQSRLDEEDANCRRYFEEMSVMQEVFAVPKGRGSAGDGRSRRVAIFLWRFRKTRPEETATTTWRRLSTGTTQAMSADASWPHATASDVPTLTSNAGPEDDGRYASTSAWAAASQSGLHLSAATTWDGSWPTFASETSARALDLHPNDNREASYYADPASMLQTPADSTFSGITTNRSSQDSQSALHPAFHAGSDDMLPSAALTQVMEHHTRRHDPAVLAPQTTYRSDQPPSQSAAYGYGSNQLPSPSDDLARSTPHSATMMASHSATLAGQPTGLYRPASALPSQGGLALSSRSAVALDHDRSVSATPHSHHPVEAARLVTPDSDTHASRGYSPELCGNEDQLRHSHADPSVCADGMLLVQLATAHQEHLERDRPRLALTPETFPASTASYATGAGNGTGTGSSVSYAASAGNTAGPGNSVGPGNGVLFAASMSSMAPTMQALASHHPRSVDHYPSGSWSLTPIEDDTLPEAMFADIATSYADVASLPALGMNALTPGRMLSRLHAVPGGA